MRRVALTSAIIGFFVLAFAGWTGGASTFACGMKALVGAAVIYVLINVAGAVVIRILVDAVMRSATNRREPGEKES